MGRRSEAGRKKQARPRAVRPDPLGQMLLPMVDGIVRTKESLFQLVQECGLRALGMVLAEDAEKVAGPKHKRQKGRRFHHWGTTTSELPFAGRRVQIERPRVRSKDGLEIALPALEELRSRDPLSDHVVEQILLGVSTRGYEKSLPEAPQTSRTRGASKSSASRRLVQKTRETALQFLERRLDEIDLAGLMIDGLEVGDHVAIVALGITTDGHKHVLGVWQGSTENSDVCTALLQNLLERGLRIDKRILIVIDGGKALRKSIRDVFGDAALVQRCQVHKMRNLRSHLPQKRHAYVIETMRDAYKSKAVSTARNKLKALVSWLERNGEVDAANSLREGLEETLTVLKLNLPPTLCRFFSTTNAIENLNGTFRRHTNRRVKNWKGGEMVQRWIGMVMADAETKFRRIRGHQGMTRLVEALRQPFREQMDELKESA